LSALPGPCPPARVRALSVHVALAGISWGDRAVKKEIELLIDYEENRYIELLDSVPIPVKYVQVVHAIPFSFLLIVEVAL
jgi:hypothetical protein